MAHLAPSNASRSRPPAVARRSAAHRCRRGAWALVTAAVAFVPACREAAPVKREPPPVPVVTAVARAEDVQERIRAVGAVESISSVTLRPQVSGQVASIVAEEGKDVAEGALLATIDPRPFQAALREAEANRDRQRALMKDAERAAALTADAMSDGGASQRELDAANARAEAARAEVASADAAVETAALNLAWCRITAPFAGRLGASLVRTGTIVKANETPLVDLSQVTPIDVAFSVPEQYLPQVKKGMAASPLTAQVTLPGTQEPLRGQLWFVDNRVDPATGQIRLKARFPNDDGRLWPGLFANVELVVGVDRQVVVIPSKAVQTSPQGRFVFVVDKDGRASMRNVTIRRTQEGLAIVEEGLAAGDVVVAEGQLRVVTGSRVVERKPGTAS